MAIGIAGSGIDANEAGVVSSQYANSLGQADPANMGGTLAPAAGSDEEGAAPSTPPGI